MKFNKQMVMIITLWLALILSNSSIQQVPWSANTSAPASIDAAAPLPCRTDANSPALELVLPQI